MYATVFLSNCLSLQEKQLLVVSVYIFKNQTNVFHVGNFLKNLNKYIYNVR